METNEIDVMPDFLTVLRKYEKWCSDDIIRGKYGDPAGLRKMILEDARATIAQLINH